MFCRSNIVNKWLECKKLWEISDSQAYTTWIKCSGLPLLAAVASTSHWDGVKTNPHAVEHRQRGGERCHSFFFFLCALLFFISAKMDEKFAFQHWCKCFYCWWMVGVVCGIISMVGGTALCCMEVGVNETCCPTVVAVTSSVWNFAAWRFWIPLLTLICF